MAGVESWPQPVGCKAQGELLGVQKLMGPSDTVLLLPCVMKGDQQSLLFRPRSISPPWCEPQRLAREDPTPLCCLGEPQ